MVIFEIYIMSGLVAIIILLMAIYVKVKGK